MDYHHVIEAAGAISLGMVGYSYLVPWFDEAPPGRRRWRPIVNGLVFGLLAIFLMRFRIDVGGDRFVDTRVIPIALATLIEGSPAGAITAGLAVAYRVWLGGSGAAAGVLGIVATAVAAGLVRVWVRRDGGLKVRHVAVLVATVWAVTAGSFLVLGARGLAMFSPVWLPLLAMTAVGIGVGARLFGDVAARQAVEAARRDAAQRRAVTALARAAAHEINNPLTVIVGSMELLQRRLTAGGPELRWIERAVDASQRIREIVARMTHITRVEASGSFPGVPAMLDIQRSSEDN